MRIFVLVFLLCVLFFFSIQRYLNPQLNHNSVSDRIQHPFDTRLRYKIGKIDHRFGLTQQDVIKIAQEASYIWLKGTKKDYFTYDPHAKLVINLIYDERQEDSILRQQEILRIKQSQEKTNQITQAVEKEKSLLEYRYNQINLKKNEYDENLMRYNSLIHQYNDSTKVSTHSIDMLENQKRYLEKEKQQLESEITRFNEQVKTSNERIKLLNDLSAENIRSIENFNIKFKPRLFDKGEFNGKEINIYEFHSKNDLKITIAHEFGHALGLLHSDHPESLMYPILEQQNFDHFSLTATDLLLLKNRKLGKSF